MVVVSLRSRRASHRTVLSAICVVSPKLAVAVAPRARASVVSRRGEGERVSDTAKCVPLDTQRQRRAEALGQLWPLPVLGNLEDKREHSGHNGHTNTYERRRQGSVMHPPRISATPPRQTRSINAKRGPKRGRESQNKGPIWDSNQEVEEKRRRSLEEEEKKRRGRRGGRARFGYVFFFSCASFLLLLQPPSKKLSVRACVAVRS